MVENNLFRMFWMEFLERKGYNSYSDMVLKNLDNFIIWSMFGFVMVLLVVIFLRA